MDQEQVQAQIIAFIQDELLDGDTTVDVGSEENLLLSGMVDSIGVMKLVAHVEDTLGLSVPAEDIVIENFVNVRTIATYLDSLA